MISNLGGKLKFIYLYVMHLREIHFLFSIFFRFQWIGNKHLSKKFDLGFAQFRIQYFKNLRRSSNDFNDQRGIPNFHTTRFPSRHSKIPGRSNPSSVLASKFAIIELCNIKFKFKPCNFAVYNLFKNFFVTFRMVFQFLKQLTTPNLLHQKQRCLWILQRHF